MNEPETIAVDASEPRPAPAPSALTRFLFVRRWSWGSVLGGLALSVVLTVFLVPAAYLLVYRREAVQ